MFSFGVQKMEVKPLILFVFNEKAKKRLMKADLIALEDHPGIPELINKVKVNIGKSK